MNNQITAARLREVLHYDPDTGVFSRRERVGRGRNGSRCGTAGTTHSKGYVTIKVDGKTYKAHRLAWLYMTGVWPADQIDHRDTNRSNNAFANLREATGPENSQNQIHPSRNNKSGRLGVTYRKDSGKWAAILCVNGKNVRLGSFADPDAASAAYLSAKRLHHPFANLGVAG